MRLVGLPQSDDDHAFNSNTTTNSSSNKLSGVHGVQLLSHSPFTTFQHINEANHHLLHRRATTTDQQRRLIIQ